MWGWPGLSIEPRLPPPGCSNQNSNAVLLPFSSLPVTCLFTSLLHWATWSPCCLLPEIKPRPLSAGPIHEGLPLTHWSPEPTKLVPHPSLSPVLLPAPMCLLFPNCYTPGSWPPSPIEINQRPDNRNKSNFLIKRN